MSELKVRINAPWSEWHGRSGMVAVLRNERPPYGVLFPEYPTLVVYFADYELMPVDPPGPPPPAAPTSEPVPQPKSCLRHLWRWLTRRRINA